MGRYGDGARMVGVWCWDGMEMVRRWYWWYDDGTRMVGGWRWDGMGTVWEWCEDGIGVV